MASQPWEDRRGMFQRGKEVHEPGKPLSQSGSIMNAVRRASTSSNPDTALDKTLSNTSPPASPTGERRRSSAAASNPGLFGNLQQHKRGSQDYAERRASHHDQNSTGGVLSGWFNSTFRGVQKPLGGDASAPAASGGQDRKGVME